MELPRRGVRSRAPRGERSRVRLCHQASGLGRLRLQCRPQYRTRRVGRVVAGDHLVGRSSKAWRARRGRLVASHRASATAQPVEALDVVRTGTRESAEESQLSGEAGSTSIAPSHGVRTRRRSRRRRARALPLVTTQYQRKRSTCGSHSRMERVDSRHRHRHQSEPASRWPPPCRTVAGDPEAVNVVSGLDPRRSPA